MSTVASGYDNLRTYIKSTVCSDAESKGSGMNVRDRQTRTGTSKTIPYTSSLLNFEI